MLCAPHCLNTLNNLKNQRKVHDLYAASECLVLPFQELKAVGNLRPTTSVRGTRYSQTSLYINTPVETFLKTISTSYCGCRRSQDLLTPVLLK